MLRTATRINTLLLVLVVLMAGAIITMLATRAYGGPLDPPGPPAATDGVRGPGTPISSLPFTITGPGYYYVTRTLNGPTGSGGIIIDASDVTLDLGGFTLFGGLNPRDGIDAGVGPNIVIRNGAVRGWANGIIADQAHVDHVEASNNTNGFIISADSEVNDCKASRNGQTGITADHAVVRRCTISGNGNGVVATGNSLIEDNRVSGHSVAGIVVNGNNNTIRDNELSGNTLDVQILAGRTGSVIAGNAYCSLTDSGTNTILSGNFVRIPAC